MSKSQRLSKEARRYIKEQIFEMGEVTVEQVSAMVEIHYSYDPLAAKDRELRNCARQILASVKGEDKTRTVLAVEGEPGRFVNIDTCKNPFLMRKIYNQINLKWEGLTKTRNKMKENLSQLKGQQSLFNQSDFIGETSSSIN